MAKKKKKKDMTPAQKAAARKNPDAPKKGEAEEEDEKEGFLSGKSAPIILLVLSFTIVLVPLGIFALIYFTDFFGMAG